MSFWEGGLGWLKKQFNDQDEDVYDTQAEEREILPEAGALRPGVSARWRWSSWYPVRMQMHGMGGCS